METSKGHEDIQLTGPSTLWCNASGWLGHSSRKMLNLLESFFKPFGHVPWSELINSLQSELLSHLEEAWLALGSRFMHPDVRSGLPPPECLEYYALCLQKPSPALPLLPAAASADAISSGLMGVSSGCGRKGLSPALTSRLPRSPSSRCRHPSSSRRQISLTKRSWPIADTSLSPVPLFMCTLVTFRALSPCLIGTFHVVTALHSHVICTCYDGSPMSFSHPRMRLCMGSDSPHSSRGRSGKVVLWVKSLGSLYSVAGLAL